MNFVRIEGYPKYAIHPAGTILRIYKNKTKEMKTIKQKNGYMRIKLTNNGKQKFFLVHRLLALHFIPNDDPDTKIEIDHKDRVRDNNNLNNLEWVTHAENMRRMIFRRQPAAITQGGIRKKKNGSWEWYYCMKGKNKSKTMKNLNDLEKYKEETLKKYLIS